MGINEGGGTVVERTRELELLRSFAASARDGRSGVVVIEGEPGIGKTWLLGALGAELSGFRRVDVEAMEGRPTIVPALPTAPFGRESTPIAMVVENAQWLDSAATEALWLALPALRATPSLVIVIGRPGTPIIDRMRPTLTAANRGALLRPSPLTTRQTIALASEHGVPALDATRANLLAELTDGNPLHLVTVFDEFGPRIRVAIPQFLPVPASYESELERDLSSISSDGRALIELLAIVGAPIAISSLLEIANAAGRAVSFDDALASGLITTNNAQGQREVELSSARVREGVRRALEPSTRRDLHRAVAGSLSGWARLEHLLLATEHTDDALATELETEGDRRAAAGQYPAAARKYSGASGVSSSTLERERRILLAGRFAFYSDDAELGGALAPTIARCLPSFERDVILAGIGYLVGDFPEAFALVRTAQQAHPSEVDGRDAFAAAVLASLQLAFVDLPGAIATSTSALSERIGVPGPAEARLRLTFAWALWIAGLIDEADEALRPVLALPPYRSERADALTIIGQRQFYSGNEAAALLTLDDAVDSARSSDALHILPFGLALRSHVKYSLGQWDAAMLDAQAVLAHTSASQNGNHDGLAHAVIAMLAAGSGELAEAEREARVSERLGVDRPLPQHRVAAAIASAVVERALGNPHAVIHALAPLSEGALALGTLSTGYTGWRAMQAEAHIALGSLDAATRLIRLLENDQGTKSFGYTGWLRGLIIEARGHPADALTEYTRAIATGDASATPYSHAIAQRARGTILASLGRQTDAAAALREATRLFTRLGATAYLPAVEPPGEGLMAVAGWGTLTPRERDTSLLAADGMLNREIASAMHVSSKTVEHHLANSLAKLGMRSRRDLAKAAGRAVDELRP